MNPILWFHNVVDLVKPYGGKLDVLTGSCDVMNNVKIVTVTTKSDNLSAKARLQATWDLLELLTALPRDALVMFTSIDFNINRHLLGALLQHHSQLDCSDFCLEEAPSSRVIGKKSR